MGFEVLHTIFKEAYPYFPKELISIISQYKTPGTMQVTQLFLQILHIDYLSEPLRQASCKTAKEWAEEVNAVDLSMTCLDFYSNLRLKEHANHWEKMFGIALRNHFPNVIEIRLPLKMRIHPLQQAEGDISQKIYKYLLNGQCHKDLFNEELLEIFAGRKIRIIHCVAKAETNPRKTAINRISIFYCRFSLTKTSEKVKTVLQIALIEYSKIPSDNIRHLIINEINSYPVKSKPLLVDTFLMCGNLSRIHGCIIT